jgi:hypothetical protein
VHQDASYLMILNQGRGEEIFSFESSSSSLPLNLPLLNSAKTSPRNHRSLSPLAEFLSPWPPNLPPFRQRFLIKLCRSAGTNPTFHRLITPKAGLFPALLHSRFAPHIAKKFKSLLRPYIALADSLHLSRQSYCGLSIVLADRRDNNDACIPLFPQLGRTDLALYRLSLLNLSRNRRTLSPFNLQF